MVDTITSLEPRVGRLGIIEVSGCIVRDSPESLEPIFREGAIPVGMEYDSCRDEFRYKLYWKRFEETRLDAIIPTYQVELCKEGDMCFVKGVK